MLIELSAIGAAVGAVRQTTEQPAVQVAKKLGGKLANDKVGDPVKRLERRLIAQLPLPRNHDLVRGLRTDYLTALQKALDYYKVDLRGLPAWEPGRPSGADAFADVVQGWLDARIHPIAGKGADLHAVTKADVAAALDPTVRPSSIGVFARQAATPRRDAERRVLEEIGEVWGDEIPPRFLRWFKGGGKQPGWYDLFALYVNERIKTDERFRSIFVAAELVDIKRLVKVLDRRIAATNEGIGRIEQMLGLVAERLPAEIVAQLVAALDARGTTATAAENGLARTTVSTLAERLRPDEAVNLDQAIVEIENAVSIAIDLVGAGARGTSHDTVVDAVLRRVAAKVKYNDLDGAARELDDELAAMEERDRVALLEGAIQVDILRRDPEAAARRIVQIAAAGRPVDREARLTSLEERWARYYEEGEQHGLNLSLEVAIAVARLALPISKELDDCGAWLVLLGLSLSTLGGRESGTERLEEAVTAYRAALEEYTRERAPQDRAMTQNNLGNALLRLGGRQSGPESLAEAVTAYRAALEEYTRERDPREWARTQNNLGTALWWLGDRESGTERLEEAVTAFRAALEERTREGMPREWARTQSNLGNALWVLGERESGTERLEEAVAAFRAALEEFTRERLPLDWATMQNNLGTALCTLGGRESGTERLEEAVMAFRAALGERTREGVPLDWARTQNNLGIALRTLGERETGTERLEEAVTACRAALEEYPRESMPLQWAAVQNNLGTALWRLGERERGTERLEEAVTVHRAALEGCTRERAPLDWAGTQNDLGNVLSALGERERGTERLEEAVAAYRAALEEYSRERVRLRWTDSQKGLDRALALLAKRRP